MRQSNQTFDDLIRTRNALLNHRVASDCIKATFNKRGAEKNYQHSGHRQGLYQHLKNNF
jgi:hypothetical protein